MLDLLAFECGCVVPLPERIFSFREKRGRGKGKRRGEGAKRERKKKKKGESYHNVRRLLFQHISIV